MDNLNNIDKETGKKVLWVIYNKKNQEHASLFSALVSKKNNIKCSMMDSKALYSNYKISSDNVLVFLGDIKEEKTARKLLINPNDKYGACYGIYGKRAYIWADTSKFKLKEKKEFKGKYEESFEKIRVLYDSPVWNAMIALLFGAIGIFTSRLITKQKLKNCLLSYGILDFCDKKIDSFLTEATK